MTADPELVAIRLRAQRAMNPPEHQAWVRAAKRVIYPDATVDLSRGVNAIPDDAAPALDLTQIAATEGSGYDTAHDQVQYVAGAYVPGGADVAIADGGTGASTASGARTNLGLVIGTDVAPVASPAFTGTLAAADVSTTGDATLGNADTDTQILRGHLRHKSAAPSIAVGAALGTGGSVGATVSGSDQRMTVTLTAGTTSLTTGTAATITFATARPNTQIAQSLTPINSAARTNAVQAGLSSHSASTVTISFNVAPTSGAVYQFDILVDEWSN